MCHVIFFSSRFSACMFVTNDLSLLVNQLRIRLQLEQLNGQLTLVENAYGISQSSNDFRGLITTDQGNDQEVEKYLTCN